MFGFDRVEIESCYRPLARFSLVLFTLLTLVHVLAVSRLVVSPRWVAFAGAVLVFPGHLLMILGVNASKTNAGKEAPSSDDELLSLWETMGKIPWRWRLVAGFLIPYAFWTFGSHAVHYPGIVEDSSGSCVLSNHGKVVRALDADECLAARAGEVALITAFGMIFSLVHYMALRYAIPRSGKVVEQ